jgi:hypothetical protein
MPSAIHGFIFDANFGFGSESVFTTEELVNEPPEPPIEGYFLQTDTTPILLTDGTFLLLA